MRYESNSCYTAAKEPLLFADDQIIIQNTED